jgi:hypothetical protein
MSVLIFSMTSAQNISHSKENSARYYNKCTSVFMSSTRYSCHIFMILEFSRQIFEKFLHIKFNEIPSNGNRAVPYGVMDRQDESVYLVFISPIKCTMLFICKH